ncbi:unnamed protein product [Brassicogethes aeneus]|uniref:Uncharacterized protein n=1 Tax=Brassicogethes aeneus TaxID=1431903 RepID=A0A9P0B4L8_BRAAE|nr:unnamed protein product [Brassicogethes aeneus]
MVLTREQTEEVKNLVDVVLKQLWKDDTYVKNITANVSQSISEAINKKLDNYEKQLTAVIEENKQIKNNIMELKDGHSTEINNLHTLMKENYISIEKFDRMEQEYKKTNLRIFNIPETPQENTKQEVLKILNNKLNIQIKDENIESCLRIGKLNNAKNRGVFIKLSSLYIRQEIFKNKKYLKGSGICLKIMEGLELINRFVDVSSSSSDEEQRPRVVKERNNLFDELDDYEFRRQFRMGKDSVSRLSHL